MTFDTQKYLLDCIRAKTESDFKAKLKSAGNPDWEWLAGEAFRGFMPVYLKAKKIHADLNMPQEIEDRLHLQYLLRARRSEGIEKAVLEVAREFNRSGIELILLKGAALILTLYKKDAALRPMSDIDILVRKADLPRAEDLLRSLGYEEDYPRLSKRFKTMLSRDYFLNHGVHFVYFRGDVRLELHWNISSECHPALLKQLSDDTVKNFVHEVEIKTLRPEANLYSACYNFIKDFRTEQSFLRHHRKEETNMFCRVLAFFCEIKIMIRDYESALSWDRFALLVKQMNKEYEIYALLLMAKKVVAADIPDSVMVNAKRCFWVSIYLLGGCHKENDLMRLLACYERISCFRNLVSRGARCIKSPKAAFSKIYSKLIHWLQTGAMG